MRKCETCSAPVEGAKRRFCPDCIRERDREYQRERYANDPEYRERMAARHMERYYNVPGVRERHCELARARYNAKAKEKFRDEFGVQIMQTNRSCMERLGELDD